MATVGSEPTQRQRGSAVGQSTETKASFKTTDLTVYVAMLVGLFV